MSDVPADQRPEEWSAGAAGYAGAFAGFTALYADEVLDLVRVGTGSAVLDVATGTGAAAVVAASRGAAVTAVDFAPGMVREARHRLDAVDADATTEVMDGEHLDLADDVFDAALSMFGLMFFPDASAGVVEMARVVRPGGRIATATWTLDLPLRSLVSDALKSAVPEIATTPERPPTWAPYGTPDGLRGLLSIDGVIDVEVRAVERRWRFDDPARFFTDMPGWSPPMKDLFAALPAAAQEEAAQAFADDVADRGGTGSGDGIAVTALLGVGTVV